MEFKDRLARLLAQNGISQSELSRKTGISDSKISCYVSGRYKPNGASLSKIAKVLGVTPAYLVGQEEPRRPAVMLSRGIPLLGKVAAGEPIFAAENVVSFLPADEPSENLFALSVKGESMSPRIMDGDVVLVRRQETAEDGDVVIALVGDEATCKIFKKSHAGVTLVPFNPAFAPFVYSGSEVDELRILGVVIESRHRWA